MLRKIWMAAGLVVAFLLVGGVALASIPDANGAIHGCRKNSDGSMRVIDSDAGQTCANGWTPLNWSQTGPQGPAGPSGMQRSIPAGNATLATGEQRRVTVLCPAGQAVIGGGWAQPGDNVHVYSSRPQVDILGEGWVFDVINAGSPTTVEFYAICTVVV
jgi:hypothetical protein